MNTGGPGTRAVASFDVEDIFLAASQCEVNPNFNPTQAFTDVGFQHRVTPDKSVLLQVRTLAEGGEELFFVRYSVTGEIRFLMPGIPIDKSDLSSSELMATIRLTFFADYRCSKESFSDKDVIASFVRNAVFHVWPYWREAVSDLCGRMRLPRVTIPMLRTSEPVAQTETEVSVEPTN